MTEDELKALATRAAKQEHEYTAAYRLGQGYLALSAKLAAVQAERDRIASELLSLRDAYRVATSSRGEVIQPLAARILELPEMCEKAKAASPERTTPCDAICMRQRAADLAQKDRGEVVPACPQCRGNLGRNSLYEPCCFACNMTVKKPAYYQRVTPGGR